MIQNDRKKIIIFDGLDLCVPVLGRSIQEALEANGFEVYHLTSEAIKKKMLYGLRKAVRKSFHILKYQKTKSFVYPKFSDHCVKKYFRQIQPDIVFSIYYICSYIKRTLLLKLKKEIGFKLFFLDTDSVQQLEHYTDAIQFLYQEIPLYEKVFSFSQAMSSMMNDLGLQHVEFFPYGSKPISLSLDHPKRYDICFVGNPDMRRVMYLEKLKLQHLVVYGKQWHAYKPLVTPQLWGKIVPKNIWDDDLYTLLSQSKIILNINFSRWNSIRSGVNLRVFEALAACGFLLTDNCGELDDLFEVGVELETFTSPEEMLDKVNYYLKYDELRQKIARNGYEKFLKCYTWDHRIKDLIQRM
jgi:spore maturation protein CgeB